MSIETDRDIDARAAWNAVHELAESGRPSLAADLAVVLLHPTVAAALSAVAGHGAAKIGLRAAEDAARESLGTGWRR